MITRRFFLVGLGLLAISVCNLFIFIFLMHLPKAPSRTIPLTPLPYCQGGCAGGSQPTIGDNRMNWLSVSSEWPTRMDIKSSDTISVLLTALPFTGPASSYKLDNHEIAKTHPSLSGEPHDSTTIDSILGPGYEAFAVAHLVTTAFDVQPLGTQEQTVNQPSIEWDWGISPKMLGTQVVDSDIEVRWHPTGKSNGEDIVRQIWRSRMVINVDEPLIDIEQISVGAVVAGFATFLPAIGLTVPWMYEQIEKKVKDRKKAKPTAKIPTNKAEYRVNKAEYQKEVVLRRYIENRGRKRRPRKPRQQVRHKGLNWLAMNFRKFTLLPRRQKIRKSLQQRMSRRVVVQSLVAVAIGGTLAYFGGPWLWSSVSRLLPIPLGKLIVGLRILDAEISSITWSPDGRYLAVLGRNGVTALVDENGNKTATFPRESSTESPDTISVVWSPDNKYFGLLRPRGVEIWDLTLSHLVSTHYGQYHYMSWSPDGKRIALASDRKTIYVWDIATRDHIYSYNGHTDYITSITWSPDSKYIASGSLDTTVQVWDATNGSLVHSYAGHYSVIASIAWSPDGNYIASTDMDGTIHIWKALSGDNLYTYFGTSYWNNIVTWSPDSSRFASVSIENDNEIEIWNTIDGKGIFTYRGYPTSVVDVVWCPDGKRIASAYEDNKGGSIVQIWGAG